MQRSKGRCSLFLSFWKKIFQEVLPCYIVIIPFPFHSFELSELVSHWLLLEAKRDGEAAHLKEMFPVLFHFNVWQNPLQIKKKKKCCCLKEKVEFSSWGRWKEWIFVGNQLCLSYISFIAVKIFEEMVIWEIRVIFYIKKMQCSYATLPSNVYLNMCNMCNWTEKNAGIFSWK